MTLKDILNNIGKYINGANQVTQAVTNPTNFVGQRIAQNQAPIFRQAAMDARPGRWQDAPIAPAAFVQSVVSNPNFVRIPKVPEIPTQVARTPIVGPLAKLNRGVANFGVDQLNVANRSFQGATKLGGSVRRGYEGNPDSVPTILGNLAESMELPAAIALYGKGGTQIAKNGLTRPGFLNTVKSGAAHSAKLLAPTNAINAIKQTADAPDLKEQAKRAIPKFVESELTAAAFGGVLSGGVYGLQKGFEAYLKAQPNIRWQGGFFDPKAKVFGEYKFNPATKKVEFVPSAKQIPTNYKGGKIEAPKEVKDLGVKQLRDAYKQAVARNDIRAANQYLDQLPKNDPLRIRIEQPQVKLSELELGKSSRPPHQQQLEQAVKNGNREIAKTILNDIPKNDPYKQTMENLFRPFADGKDGAAANTIAAKTKGVIRPQDVLGDQSGGIRLGAEVTNPLDKMRGFPKTVSSTVGTPKQVAQAAVENPSNYYSPLSNKEVVGRVSKMITQNEQGALQLARTGKDTDANAAAMLLIDKYIKAGKYEQANQLITEVSPRFTEQGQQIQILSLYGRLTPTGAIKYTQRLLDQANAGRPEAKKLVLTPENSEKIVELAKGVQKYKEGTREYDVAVAKMMKEITAQVPASRAQKIATIQTMAQLLNPKTAIRNVVGNTAFAGAENTSTAVGSVIDRGVSVFTGRRSVTMPSFGAQAKGFSTGLKYGIEDAKLGIDTSGRATQFDLPKQTFNSGVLSKAEKALNMELRATDRAFATAAYEESLVNQMKAAGVKQPTAQMVATAEHDALYRTFQDNSKVAEILSGLKKIANKPTGGEFGAGDIFLKYPKTPGNLVARGLDYSPVGFIKTVYELARPAVGVDVQRNTVMNFSRALTGTGIITTGAILAKLGLLTGRPPKDADISGTQKATNDSPFRLNISGLKRFFDNGFNPASAQVKDGDVLVSYDWLQPNAIGLSMGADMVLNKDKKTGISGRLNSAIESLGAAEESITGQPVIQNAARFLKVAGNPNLGGFSGALANLATDTPATFIPSLVNQTAQFFDTNENGEVISRSTYDPNPINQSVRKVVSRIPGIRQNLEPNVDVFGNTSTYIDVGGKNPLTRAFNIAVNPAFLSRYMETPEASLVLDIFNRSGETQQAPRIADKKVTINGENVALSPEKYRAYQEFIGQGTKNVFQQLAQNPQFMALSDEQKASEMASILSDINTIAKMQLFGNQPKTVSGNARALAASGLLNMNTPQMPVAQTLPTTGGQPMGTGLPQANGGGVFTVIKDGQLQYIDISQPINYPQLTGMTELDKKLKSDYYSQLNKRITDVVDLVQAGQMAPQEAERIIAGIKAIQTASKMSGGGSGRAKAPKFKKITARGTNIKVKIPKSAAPKPQKLPKIKVTKRPAAARRLFTIKA